MVELKEYIDLYSKLALSFFPVPEKSKQSIVEWKQYQSRKPTGFELNYWRTLANSNLAIVCGAVSGNLVVLDCDTEDVFFDLDRVIASKIGKGSVLDFTRVSRTGKGYHIWLRTGTPVKCCKFPMLDIKGEGGYIIAPPSIHPSGTEYKFLNQQPIRVIESLYDIGVDINQKTNTELPPTGNQPGWVSRLLCGVSEGGRNDAAIKLAGFFRNTLPKDVTEHLLFDWNKKNSPPLLDRELQKVVTSAYQLPEHPFDFSASAISTSQRDKSVTKGVTQGEIENWIKDTNGWWTVEELDRETKVISSNDMTNRRTALKRLAERGDIEKHPTQNKLYRRIIKNLRRIDFKMVTDKEPLKLVLPLGLEKLVNTYPGNIIVVAGSPDSGKTALLLNVVRMNMDNFPVYYFSSEMGEQEFANRLSKFEGIELDKWNFVAEECASNFTDVIRPDAINIIDYLELTSDVYMVAEHLKSMHDKLGKGIAIVALQKKRGAELGRGAEFSLEKPRLYLSMDAGITTIQKGKNWAKQDVNPNGLKIKYKIVGGCKFIVTDNWYREEYEF